LPKKQEILETLVNKDEWLTLKEIMEEMNLSYDNKTEVHKQTRKLTELNKFDFIMIKIVKNESGRGWGHRIYKAKQKCKRFY
jgi:predicted transcriptional regulator